MIQPCPQIDLPHPSSSHAGGARSIAIAWAAGARRPRYRGFSFTEVMFAVIILGIGFIMIAAVFPVSIQQSRDTQQETSAAMIARGALRVIQQAATSTLMPATNGKVVTMRNNAAMWTAIAGETVVRSDPRYAWAAVYRRSGDPADSTTWASQAQVTIFVFQVRNTSTFDSTNVAGSPDNLEPKAIKLAVVNDGVSSGVDKITLSAAASGTDYTTASATGAYVIVADDQLGTPNTGLYNAQVFRLGANVGSSFTDFELQPGNDFEPQNSVTSLLTATGFLIGRGTQDPNLAYNSSSNPLAGPAQDVAVYTTFIPVN